MDMVIDDKVLQNKQNKRKQRQNVNLLNEELSRRAGDEEKSKR